MFDFLDYIYNFTDFFLFWKTVGFEKFVRFFWFFFIFEFPRYVIVDYIVLLIYELKQTFLKPKVKRARELLFKENPLVSIIVPGKDEGEHLYYLAKSLNEQTYKNIEIIIIDDGSEDNTKIIAKKLLKEGKIHKYLRNEVRGGKASAANFGFYSANGKFIVHIDADSSFDRDAIENILIPFYIDKNIGAVAGNVKVRNADQGVLTSLQAIEYLKTISIGRRIVSSLGILRMVSGALGAFRRDLLERIGGWDIGPGLDGDITVKIRKLGYKVVFTHNSICFTSVPETLKAFIRQRIRWSRSLIRFRVRKHKDIYFPNENFSITNFISFFENIIYSIVFNFKWLIYLGDIIINFPTLAKYIIPANYLLYLFSNIFQFMLIILTSERKREEIKLAIYLPLMPLYVGILMRAIRTYAYIVEFFFKSSYKDRWNPQKVSKKAKEIGI